MQQALGLPIHHYVEVDFFGFKDLVDAIGGVEICSLYAAQDTNTGLRLDPGCTCSTVCRRWRMPAAATTRSSPTASGRGPTADIGRTKRQQQFVRHAADRC